MEFGPLHVVLLLISLIPVTHAQGRPKAVLSISPATHVYSSTIVTFTCDIEGGGDTEWTYSWYKNNDRFDSTDYFTIWPNGATDSGNYTCRGNSSDSQSSEISDAVTLTVSERPDLVLSISPQNWVTEGDSVTLKCEVNDSSTDWKITWFKSEGFYRPTAIIDSHGETINGDSYTLSSVTHKDTGIYECEGEREEMFGITWSVSQRLWITGESPPVSLIINPNRTEHFINDSLSLSCEEQGTSTFHTVRRYTLSDEFRGSDCSRWASVTGSTCNISSLSLSHTGVYWCEYESGEKSNPVNITVHAHTDEERMRNAVI